MKSFPNSLHATANAPLHINHSNTTPPLENDSINLLYSITGFSQLCIGAWILSSLITSDIGLSSMGGFQLRYSSIGSY